MLNFNLATTCTCSHALLAYVALGCLRVVQRILLPITSFSVALMNVPIQRHDSCSLHASRTTILSSWSWRVAFFNCMASPGLMWGERRSSWYCGRLPFHTVIHFLTPWMRSNAHDGTLRHALCQILSSVHCHTTPCECFPMVIQPRTFTKPSK